MSTDAMEALAEYEQRKDQPATKLAVRRANLEEEIHRAIRRFEDETGFGVKEVRVVHPVNHGGYEAMRWNSNPVEAPLPCSVACSLYSSVMKGRLFSDLGEMDVTHLLPDAEPPKRDAIEERGSA